MIIRRADTIPIDVPKAVPATDSHRQMQFVPQQRQGIIHTRRTGSYETPQMRSPAETTVAPTQTFLSNLLKNVCPAPNSAIQQNRNFSIRNCYHFRQRVDRVAVK